MVHVELPANAAAPVIRMGNGPPVPVISAALPPTALDVSWWQIAAAVWLLGTAVFLVCHIQRHRCFLKLTARWSEAVSDEQTWTLFQALKTEMGIFREIGLRVCDSIGSPMMIGLIRPCILLPGADFAPDERRFILKYELVHYKRKDLWQKAPVLAASAIHRFNPAVHLMSKAIVMQCELSCNAEVVRSTDAAGTVNVAATRDASGQLTGLERISDEEAQQYQSAADDYEQAALKGLEERVEAKVNALYPET